MTAATLAPPRPVMGLDAPTRPVRRPETATAAPAAVARPLDPELLFGHVDRLYRTALALCGSPVDAEDLVQETFAQVLARPRRLRDGDELGYLLRALRNTFVSEHRRRQRRPNACSPTPDEIDHAAAGGPGHDVVAHAHEVLAAVAALPAAFRDVVVAVDVTGLSYAEAADALEIAEGTVMSRLYRGRRRLADALGTA